MLITPQRVNSVLCGKHNFKTISFLFLLLFLPDVYRFYVKQLNKKALIII